MKWKEGWGRYAGYFFYSYFRGGRIKNGPFPSRIDAALAASDVNSLGNVKAGKIWQQERPVIL